MLSILVVPPENLIQDDARGAYGNEAADVMLLTQLLLALRSRFTRRARLEADNLIQRHSW